MKRLPLLLAFLILLSFFSATQGSLQTSSRVKSSGTIEYSTQTLILKHFTWNAYGIFDTTPENYAEIYDLTGADQTSNVKTNIAAVKAINPNFIALMYWNFRSASSYSMPEVYDECVANNWFLKDAAGNPVSCDVGYLIDVGNANYQTYIATYTKNRMNICGYDGIFADNSLFYGAGEAFWGREDSGQTPINPRTGHSWTNSEIRQAYIALHKAIKNAIGSKLLCCNNVFSGYRFWDHQNDYEEYFTSSPMDGVMSEGMWHPYLGSTPCIWMSEANWKEAVDFLVWIQDNWLSGHPSRFHVPVAKLAKGNQVHTSLPAGATLKQIVTYAYCSTLLGAKTATAAQIYFTTNLGTSDLQSINIKQLYDAPIGTPTNNYYKVSGTSVYARDFSNGKVLVNPTDLAYSVSLNQNYVTLDGQTLSSLNIGPHTGVILKSGS
jgi:hypothetical protein